MPTILDLCGGTGAWSRPYAEAGYEVVLVTLPTDVRTWSWSGGPVQGVLAAPPCTEFAVSGARWWAGKPPELLIEAKEVARACLRIIDEVQPVWWALENPVGRISQEVPELGKWSYTFQPWQYGDPETKRTCIWGKHVRPEPTIHIKPDVVEARVHRLPPTPERAMLRSITPAGYANAFFRSNL